MNDPITRQMYQSCRLCPRMCGIDRSRVTGFCGCGDTLRAARAALHQWEEPPISGTRGSGTIFFSGCPLGCVFCQNEEISHRDVGKPVTVQRLRQGSGNLLRRPLAGPFSGNADYFESLQLLDPREIVVVQANGVAPFRKKCCHGLTTGAGTQHGEAKLLHGKSSLF